MVKYVYDFCEGSKEMLDLLGGKGANLAEMTNLGLPVPPGFTITTEACRTFLTTGSPPPVLRREISEHLARLESDMGKSLGDPARSPAGIRAERGQVLYAGHDGYRARRRAQRQLRRRTSEAVR